MSALILRNSNSNNNNNITNNNSRSSNTQSGNSDKPKKSVHYQLFMHKEELRRREAAQVRMAKSKINPTESHIKANIHRFADRDADQMRIAKSKINLTQSLIKNNMENVTDCSMETLQIIHREMSFQKHLQSQLECYALLIKFGFRLIIANGPTRTQKSVHQKEQQRG